jgi:putative heme-binding domain-containing protein
MIFRKPVFTSAAGLLLAAQTSMAQAPPPAAPKPNPAADAGAQVFKANCSRCHGLKGEGLTGPALTSPRLPRAPNDDALFRLIYFGIAGTEMPSHLGLTEIELKQVGMFVRALAAKTEPAAPGNPFGGDRIYRGAGCDKCHTMEGAGGTLGPDLSAVGLRRNAAFVRTALVDPSSFLPEGFVLVRAVAPDGKTTTGIRISEDAFSIRLRTASGALFGFWKSDLKELRREPGKSPMPSFKETLTGAQIDDVVAYLMTRKGGK